jgi:diaminohydroxyphosphoribosylaminopyrimidine deaminase/5-amino-6-(5-phosphoribosylamino)uracil reductase
MMRRALSLARRGQGRVEPNPMVGCVIVRRGRIIGEGYHRAFGGPHAEVNALSDCSSSPRGSTVYVTLEPCSHFGKTPPCADALIAARVREVVIGCADPHVAVSGGGLAKLRQAGVGVRVGIEAERAQDLVAPFRVVSQQGRPYVTAKWAQSLDGKTATRTGDSQWISCATSRKWVHRLRARVDAVMVGSETVLRDDPMLTARDVRIRRSAARIVWDRRLRMPTNCALARTAGTTRTIVLTSEAKAKSRKARALSGMGVDIVPCPLRGDHLDPRRGLRKLGKEGMTNVLLEGGATILASFFEAKLIDEAHVFVSPIIIGGDDATGAVGGQGVSRVAQAWAGRDVSVRRSGTDWHYTIRP